jgi:acetoin:2,6-dichlorophenolindophenol oxidoreductase subunit beta
MESVLEPIQIMTCSQAACLALQQEMERDSRVWALGEDLGPEGGVAGQYLGLQQRFGKQRIVDTPISESQIAAAAIGAAITGTRPVAELRYADFGFCATDEIINQAAKIRYMLGGQVRTPVVFRMSIGMRSGMAAQHSQSNESLWIGTPGLVVMAPSNPADQHSMLKAAIRSDDPVIFLEHKELWGLSDHVNPQAPPSTIGKGRLLTQGDDLTLVTWSSSVHACLKAHAQLSEMGMQAELIDLRTLWPWDRELVQASLKKTGRLMVVHESIRTVGLGAEIVSDITEKYFQSLRCPPVRLASPRIPVPYSKPLEDLCRVDHKRIVDAALQMMENQKK